MKTLLIPTLLAAFAQAQGLRDTQALQDAPAQPLTATLADRAPALPIAALRVPIHTMPGDEERYGWWAAGPNYKASFHDGFVFYPFVSSQAPRALRMRWTTESITVGGAELIAPGTRPDHARDTWHYYYQYPGVTEAYEVRAEGVEQTFWIHQRPVCRGDLVVTGRLQTDLQLPAQLAPRHGALELCDDQQRAVMSYGAAYVVDARGSRAELTTAVEGTRVRLTVPEAWLATAEFPIVVDPLTQSYAIAHGDIVRMKLGREYESTRLNTMVFYRIDFALNDGDLFAFLCDSDFQNPWLVYYDVDTNSSEANDIAFAGGADQWALAYEKEHGDHVDARLYRHAKGSIAQNSGSTHLVGTNSLLSYNVALGGSLAGNTVLVARSRGVNMFNALTGTVGPTLPVNPPGILLNVDINSYNAIADPWIVVFQIPEAIPNVYSIYGMLVDPSYAGNGTPSVLQAGTDMQSSGWAPLVDGRDGRYLLSMIRGPIFFFRGEARRLDWPRSSAQPILGPTRSLPMLPGDLAHDFKSRSHWCVTGQNKAARLGLTGATVETVPLQTSEFGFGPTGVVFSPEYSEFQIVYEDDLTSAKRLVGVRFRSPTLAANQVYGTGCRDNGVAISAGVPHAGSEFFKIRMQGVAAGTPCVLTLSLSSAAITLPNGCLANVGPSLIAIPTVARLPIQIPPATTAVAEVTYPLPDMPKFEGLLFAQWAWTMPFPLAPGMSKGLRMQVR